MIIALAAFILSDIIVSICLRRFLITRPFFWAGAIASLIYNIVTAALYLHLITHQKFLLVFDAMDLSIRLWPFLFIFCLLMMLFHSWAFLGGTER